MDEGHNSQIQLDSGPIRIDKWTFYPDLFKLEREGEEVKLEPRAARLLLYLASNTGKSCTRQTLIDHAWPNRVVGDEVLTSAINKLRKALGDDSHQPRYIETIPKYGYRLVAQIQSESPDQLFIPPKFRFRFLFILLGGISIGLGSFIGYKLWYQQQSDNAQVSPTHTEHLNYEPPTIAVLPFINIGQNAERKYLSDGISESLIVDLSRQKGLTVIARHSSFFHRTRLVSTRDIGMDLGAKYILDGSIQAEGNNLRISATLIEAATGHQLWANRFDRELDDIFELQDEITHEVTKALPIHITSINQDRVKIKKPASFEAYDRFLQAQTRSVELSDEAFSEAISLYREAIQLDPEYAHAYGALAVARIREYLLGYSETPVLTKNRALELAKRAVEMDPESHQVHWSLGYVHLYRKEFTAGELAANKSIALSSSYADGYSLLALFKNNLGKFREAITLIEKAMELNPHYTWDYIYQLGRAYYALGEYDRAVNYLERALERNESTTYPRLFLAATYVNLDQIDDAEWQIELLRSYRPQYTSLDYLQKTMPIGDQVLLIKLMDDLKQAGLPE